MKYTSEIVIDRPRDVVLEVLTSREEAFKWMKGLKEFSLIEGIENEVNSKHKMVFDNNGRTEIMTETITRFDVPDVITTVYEMDGVWNECVNRFYEKDGQTLYVMEVSFKFPFLMNLFIWMAKGMFQKQTMSSMVDLKNHIESTK